VLLKVSLIPVNVIDYHFQGQLCVSILVSIHGGHPGQFPDESAKIEDTQIHKCKRLDVQYQAKGDSVRTIIAVSGVVVFLETIVYYET